MALTAAARQRKIRAAHRRLAEALALLDEVNADLRDLPGRMSVEHAQWGATTNAAGHAERARDALADHL